MSKGIYCYIDNENDKIVYIGKDSNIDKNKRHRDHLAPSKHNEQPINRILQNNPDRYIYQVLWEIDNCTDNHLNQMEIFYIKKYAPQFNFTEGGDGMSGFKHSEETRKKISEANKDKIPWNKGKINVYSEETKKKMKEVHKGKTLSEETRKKISENHARYWQGKTRSEEAKKKMSENNARYWQGKTLSEETRKKISEANKGKIPWNKGKINVYSEETRKKMSEARKGKNHPMYGKTLSEETRKKISESKKGKTLSKKTKKKISKTMNTTGFYRVFKQKNSGCKQGFIWGYYYPYKLTRKTISSTDLKKLEKKVKTQSLPWEIIDEEKAKKSLRENEVCT